MGLQTILSKIHNCAVQQSYLTIYKALSHAAKKKKTDSSAGFFGREFFRDNFLNEIFLNQSFLPKSSLAT